MAVSWWFLFVVVGFIVCGVLVGFGVGVMVFVLVSGSWFVLLKMVIWDLCLCSFLLVVLFMIMLCYCLVCLLCCFAGGLLG